MQFGSALASLKDGHKIKKQSWGKEDPDYLYLVNASQFKVNRPPLLGLLEEGDMVSYRRHIDAFKERAIINEAWVWDPTQEDILAEDWVVVDNSA